jgi:hypothetical protein
MNGLVLRPLVRSLPCLGFWNEASRSAVSESNSYDRERVVEMVQVDSDIMGGAPVFRGTRIPVHLIAEMIE